MPHTFHVTYDIITDQSSEDGDYAENGFITTEGDHIAIDAYMELKRAGKAPDVEHRLRDALALLDENDGPLEPSAGGVPRWVTRYADENEQEEWENRSLHFPESLSEKNVRRICRLLGMREEPQVCIDCYSTDEEPHFIYCPSGLRGPVNASRGEKQ